LLEAQSTGLPAIGSQISGIAEAIIDGRTGLLVPPHQENALADAMRKMTTLHPGERALMGRSGRELTSVHYNVERVVDCWESLYWGLLNEANPHEQLFTGNTVPYSEA